VKDATTHSSGWPKRRAIPLMKPDFDIVHYYAFILDALSRFGSEGRHLRHHRLFAPLRKRKPVHPILAGVADEMRKRGLRNHRSCILEFGVFEGRSIKMLSSLFPESRLFGFDTFSGFPEDGRNDWQLDFSVSGIPSAPANAEFIVGPFEQTLEPFLKRAHIKHVSLVHVDCDIFSAAATALETLDHRIAPGTVIVFDELVNYAEFPENELLALYLFLQARNLDFEWFVTIGEIYPFEDICLGKQPPNAFIGYRNLCCYQNTSIIIKGPSKTRHRMERYLPTAYRLARERPMQRPFPEGCLPKVT
jgi:hypothetical protein